MKTLAEMTAEIGEVNYVKGFRETPHPWGDYVALLHSEVSEMLEAYRRWGLDDATDSDGDRMLSLAEIRPPKPEGVGSEAADVLIRLLDMCDVHGVKPFDMDMQLADIAPIDMPQVYDSFGGDVAWLHLRVSLTLQTSPLSPEHERMLAYVLRALVAVCEKYGIDLYAEYTRKIAYNRTREHRHGGKRL